MRTTGTIKLTGYKRTKIITAVLLATLALAALTACGDTAATPTSAPVSTPTATVEAMDMSTEMPATVQAEPTSASQETPTSQGTGSVTDVQATLKEWSITLSQSEVPAGKIRFTVTNAGEMMHNFTVTNDSGTIDGTPNFSANQGPQTLEVELQPGTYTVICSLAGHAQRGQRATLTVK